MSEDAQFRIVNGIITRYVNQLAMEAELRQARESNEENANLERMQSMFDKEVSQLQLVFNRNLWYIGIRRLLVDWISERVSSHPLNMSTLATHIAVHFLDRILSSYEISQQQLKLVASACIYIAVKMEEKDNENFPNLQTFVLLCNGEYSRQLLARMEMEILGFFNWRMNVVTALHFIGHFSQYYLDVENDIYSNQIIPQQSFNSIQQSIGRYAEFFGDITLQHYEFCEFKYSAVAAACIYCARRKIRIAPSWSPLLAYYTTYSEHEISGIANCLWQLFALQFPDDAKIHNANNNSNDDENKPTPTGPNDFIQAAQPISPY